MPILETKRAVESVLSVFCMEEVGQEVKKGLYTPKYNVIYELYTI